MNLEVVGQDSLGVGVPTTFISWHNAGWRRLPFVTTGVLSSGPYEPATLTRDLLSGATYVIGARTYSGFRGYFCREYVGGSLALGGSEVGELAGALVFPTRELAVAAYLDRTGLDPIPLLQRHSTRCATFDGQNTQSMYATQLKLWRWAMEGVFARFNGAYWNALGIPYVDRLTSQLDAAPMAHWVRPAGAKPSFQAVYEAAHDIAMHLSAYPALPVNLRAQRAWDYIVRGYGVFGDYDGVYYLYEAP